MADDVFKKAAEKLSSPSEGERKDAVLALLKLKDRRAIDLLVKLCEMDRSVEVRFNARKAYYLLRDIHPNNLAEPFLELPDGISFDDLEKLLLDENPRIRGEAIQLAGKLDPQSTAPPLRLALAAEKSSQLQGRILLGLGRAGLKYDIPTIAEFLSKGDPRIQTCAIEALAMIGGADALECIVPLLRDTDSGVRTSATKALPPLDGGEMLNLLRGMAMSPNIAYRDAAIFSLQRFKAPLAAKILGHLAAIDPVIPLRDKARAGLEAMAKSNEEAKKALEQLNTPEEPEDPNAPATVPLDGIWETTAPDLSVPAGAPTKPKFLVVPGLTKKLVKAICLGDQAQREDGLRQLAPLLKLEHIPFLLLQLDREKDPRIASHLLSLIGVTRSPQTYAAVVKRFKDVDHRVRANAIEVAMQIDPDTTPDRIAGFLNDPNNRVRANTILASATRPNFDPLVWVRDLAAFGDPAYRRSALFVISRLKHPTFLEVLEILVFDDDMEVRHMALRSIQEYAGRGVKKAKELAERADKVMNKAGMSDQDFHAAMVAMRAPTVPKKVARKSSKSATEEFGEQLLGSDGLKNLKDQAKVAREKAAARLSQTAASLAEVKWLEKFLLIAKPLALVIILILHAISATGHFRTESPLRLISLGAAILAVVSAVVLGALRRPGLAGILVFLLFLIPIAASHFDVQDADITGGPRVAISSDPASRTSAIASAVAGIPDPKHPGGNPSVKPIPGKNASASQQVKAPGATIKLLAPSKGAKILGKFEIKAKVTGKPKSVEFFLDKTCLKTFEEKREGNFNFDAGSSDDHPPGRYVIKVRVTDIAGLKSEDQYVVQFMSQLAGIAISSPASGAVFWRDDRFSATVSGKGCDQVEFLLDDLVINTFPADPAGKYEYPVPIATLTEGAHTFAVRASMTDGQKASDSVTFRALIPRPTVTFVSPKTGEDVFGTVGVSLKADSGWKETAIRRVTFYTDGLEKKVLASPPWQISWETGDLATGPHELKASIENELDGSATAVIQVNVLQPKVSAAIKGIRSGQVLAEDTQGSVEVINDFPGTKIEKVVLSVDGKPFQEVTSVPFRFTVRVNDILPGVRKLTAEAFRSDGQTFNTTLSFSVNQRNRRSLFFAAQDAGGKPLTAPNLEKFRLDLKEDGKSVGSYSLQPAGASPLHLGLLIDVSATMKSDQKLAKTKEALSAFIDGMKPKDQSFLLKFSDAPEVVADFTQDRTKLQQEIEYLTTQRGTALLDAVYKGVEVSARVPETTTMVLLADSGDGNVEGTGPASKHSQAEVLEFARRHDVQIFAIGLGTPSQGPAFPGEEELRALAKNSGGRFYSITAATELPALFAAVMRDIREQAKISFLSPSGPPDGKWHSLEISVPDHKDLKFLYKPGYQAR